MPLVASLKEKYGKHVDFLIVYTLEAHATDEWPINNSEHTRDGKPVNLRQSQSIDERLSRARTFTRVYFDMPYAVDTMDNNFEQAFASWPTRFYVVNDGKLTFKARTKGVNLDVASMHLVRHLADLVPSVATNTQIIR